MSKDQPRDQASIDEALAALTRTALTSSLGPGGSDCPDAALIAAYYDGSLGTAERTTIETHVSGCRRCQEGLAAVARADFAERAPAAAVPDPYRPALWKWLVPIAAAGTAFALWLAVRPSSIDRPVVSPAPPASAPAERSEPSLGTRNEVALDRAAARKDAAQARKPSKQPDTPQSRLLVERKTEARTTTPARSQPAVGALVKETAADRADQPSLNAKLADQDERTPIAGSPAPPPARQEEAQAKVAAAPMAEAMSASIDKLGALESNRENRLRQQTVVEVSAPDGSTRWRLEPDGSISRSRDAGTTWQRQRTGSRERLAAASAPAPNVCWAVGLAGTIFRTIDGERWGPISSPTSADLTAIDARSELVATTATGNGRRYNTTDGGKTWQPR